MQSLAASNFTQIHIIKKGNKHIKCVNLALVPQGADCGSNGEYQEMACTGVIQSQLASDIG